MINKDYLALLLFAASSNMSQDFNHSSQVDDDPEFVSFKEKLRERDGIEFTRAHTDDQRTIQAEWLEKLSSEDVIAEPIQINYAIIEGNLNLQHTTFKSRFSITESEFKGVINLSFATFEHEFNLKGSHFCNRVDFRGAHAENDFHIPLARFSEYTCFEDLCVDGLFSAEGTDFQQVDFNRVNFSRSSLFCNALLEDGRASQTHFRGEVNFNDAHFKGPTYFCGAYFHNKAIFDRARIESSAFFNCDNLGEKNDPSQPRHKRHQILQTRSGDHRRTPVMTIFKAELSFIGARIHSSISFSGVRFEKKADFRRVWIEGTALFDPFTSGNTDTFIPVHFGGQANFWSADIQGFTLLP